MFVRDRHFCVSLIILGAAIFIGACVPATPAPTPTATPCPPISSVAPQVISPNSQLVPDLQPTLQWVYGGACHDAFGLEIAPDGDFTAPGIILEQTSGPQTTWTLTEMLQPASVYAWRAYAISGTSTGPYSPEPWFWTGPICPSSVPDVPELVSPIQGEIVIDPSPPLDWSYPDVGCLPEAYQFQVSTLADFQQTVLSGSTGSPQTSFETGVEFLQDCTTYYWRVAVQHGLVPAEYSLVEQFSTDFQGTCNMTPLETPTFYAIGCTGTQSMLMTFQFPDPPQASYQARAMGTLFDCFPNESRPVLLHCTGLRIVPAQTVLIELVNTQSGAVIFSGEERIPSCN
jgi:hypothetical protein